MSKKYLSILGFVLIIFLVFLVSRYNQDKYYPEVTWEEISFKEISSKIRDRINSKPLEPNFTMHIDGGTGGISYIVITPPKNKAIEIVSIEKSKDNINTIKYKYRIIERTKGNTIDNIKIIKVNNFAGRYEGVEVRD